MCVLGGCRKNLYEKYVFKSLLFSARISHENEEAEVECLVLYSSA